MAILNKTVQEFLSEYKVEEKDGILVNDTRLVGTINVDKDGLIKSYSCCHESRGEPLAEYSVRFQQGRRPRIFYPRKFHFRKRAYFDAVFMCNLPDYERQKKQGLYYGRERACIPTLKMKMKWKEISDRILAN